VQTVEILQGGGAKAAVADDRVSFTAPDGFKPKDGQDFIVLQAYRANLSRNSIPIRPYDIGFY
jgi:hypothetical protein